VRIVLQRVARASVTVDGSVAGSIGEGLLLLVGIEPSDTEDDVASAFEKVINIRVFPDEDGRMNRSLLEVGGSVLIVSQFTLLGDIRKGRRPSYVGAAPPEVAEPMIERLVRRFRETGVPTETGVFGAAMEVELVNSGPVTLVMSISQGTVR
jgi:D-tyrosyl-tRNA(Tyr) deacylase